MAIAAEEKTIICVFGCSEHSWNGGGCQFCGHPLCCLILAQHVQKFVLVCLVALMLPKSFPLVICGAVGTLAELYPNPFVDLGFRFLLGGTDMQQQELCAVTHGFVP